MSGKSSCVVVLAVIFAVLGCLALSANAIRCHQCNSHLDEDCVALRLSIPRAIRDEQYLQECEGDFEGKTAFCRKTVSVVEASKEQRIVRGCGWLTEKTVPVGGADRCFSADSEGFDQTICTCLTDGCNSAPLSIGGVGMATLAAALVASVFASRYL